MASNHYWLTSRSPVVHMSLSSSWVSCWQLHRWRGVFSWFDASISVLSHGQLRGQWHPSWQCSPTSFTYIVCAYSDSSCWSNESSASPHSQCPPHHIFQSSVVDILGGTIQYWAGCLLAYNIGYRIFCLPAATVGYIAGWVRRAWNLCICPLIVTFILSPLVMACSTTCYSRSTPLSKTSLILWTLSWIAQYRISF